MYVRRPTRTPACAAPTHLTPYRSRALASARWIVSNWRFAKTTATTKIQKSVHCSFTNHSSTVTYQAALDSRQGWSLTEFIVPYRYCNMDVGLQFGYQVARKSWHRFIIVYFGAKFAVIWVRLLLSAMLLGFSVRKMGIDLNTSKHSGMPSSQFPAQKRHCISEASDSVIYNCPIGKIWNRGELSCDVMQEKISNLWKIKHTTF